MPASTPALVEGPDARRNVETAAFEAQRTRAERRRGGIFNTPWSVAVEVASTIDAPGVVCDLSCGTGTLLLAAAERLVSLGLSRRDAAASLVGVDVDADAISVARARLAEWAGSDVARIVVGDALAPAIAASLPVVDHIVGNPPFVDALHPRFLALGASLARSTVTMIVPRSALATANARGARESCVDAGFGVAAVHPVARVFDASVDACIVVLRRSAPHPTGATWSSLLVEPDVPEVHLGGAPLAESADVVAGFRQHFYGLRGHVVEGGDGLPLVTSGSIEPARWGGRSVRFDGVRYDDPRVAIDDVDDPVRTWFAALLRPKVVVATQTRVLEAAADERGEVLPSVPVISVVPHDPSMVWHLLAVVLAPPVTAWAVRSWGGTALSAKAMKLGSPQVRAIPMPSPSSTWDEAAALLRDGCAVVAAGARMCEAYGVGEEVHAWWADRLR
jgi:SAM-dependent methyltransferase